MFIAKIAVFRNRLNRSTTTSTELLEQSDNYVRISDYVTVQFTLIDGKTEKLDSLKKDKEAAQKHLDEINESINSLLTTTEKFYGD